MRKANSEKSTVAKPQTVTFVNDSANKTNRIENIERREIYCDRLVATAETIHSMIDCLRREGGNEALLQRAEVYFQCAFLAAGWSMDLIDGDTIDFIM